MEITLNGEKGIAIKHISVKILFLWNLEKNLLSVYMEITLNDEKGIVIKHISVTKFLIEHHDVNFFIPSSCLR